MLFFLNDGIQEKKSGIEHAQIQRLHLFEKNNEPAMIVTRQYSNLLHQITNAAGIADEHFVNLFDYFQEARLVPQKAVTIRDLQINPAWHRHAEGVDYAYDQDGHRIMYVRRNNDRKKTVINVQIFDHFGKLLLVKWFDNRGFISVEHVYDWTGKVATENYYTPTGRLAIQIAKLKNKRDREVASYHLFGYRGKDYHFADFDSFTSFFLDQLVTDSELCGNQPVGIVVDRVYENGWAALHMKNHVPRYMQLHNDHVNNNADMLHSTLNYNYEWGFRHLTDWDGVITLTPQQQKDVQARYGQSGVPIFRVPSTAIPDEVLKAAPVPFAQRKKHSVITVARLSPEKQQEQLIAAWPAVLEKVPDAQLDLWGYANDNYDQKLKKQVKNLGLEGSVHFRGYTNNIAKVDNEAQLMVLPSRVEGLPISLIEAQAHGLPAIANDIKYGPNDIIIDQRDGLLTKNGDIKGLAQAITSLLTNEERLAAMSKNAYQDRLRYSGPNVMKQWQQVIANLRQKEAEK